MKTIKYILGTIVLAATLSACVKDLNVTPIDPNANTADKALTDQAGYESFLAGIYTGFATSGFYGANGSASISGLDGGASQYIRGLYHHTGLTTDEAVCGWNDQTIKNFHYQNWTTDDTFIYAFYSRIFMQVSMANEFIREAKASEVTFSDKEEYIAEARVLRALAYYHAIDNFGNVPFADETAIVGQNPTQMLRADLYNWLETELTDLIDNSALAGPRANGYARADKGVAKFILAKLYLNAKVFTGTAQWQKCADVLKDLMDDGYSLHTSTAGVYSPYQELFLADNNRCTDEIIFAIEQDGVNTTSYGATNYLIFASTGGTMDVSKIGISSGWGGLRTTPQFYNKFSSGDARALFYTSGQKKEIDDIGDFTNGYAFMKYLNIKSDGNPGQESGFVDTDFPMMRYADVLLMAAECQVNGASIDGLSAYNQVRKRAGVPEAKSIVLQDVLDERARELYQECWRRNDLIRYGQFTTGDYLWQWKGGTKDGTSVDDHFNLFPIPDSDRLANSNLEQNPGYSAN
ncbi:MAG: RagB/SusD family nutrient uptake outer membrane protein [Bacteroidales bacterium]|nr:RagB/SusD family nutrient uptake outer membrane protein [Bacteroidales bacterium]